MRKSQIIGAIILLLLGLSVAYITNIRDHPEGKYRIVAEVEVSGHKLSVSLSTSLGSSDGQSVGNVSVIYLDSSKYSLRITGLSSYARRPGNKFWAVVSLYVGNTSVSLFSVRAYLLGPNGLNESMVVKNYNSGVRLEKSIRVNSVVAFGVFVFIVIVWALTSFSSLIVALLIPVLAILLVNLPAYDVLSVFWDPSVALIFGAFILAYSMQKNNLAERLTYLLISRAKTPSKILVYMSLVAYFLGMWMSSLATMIVMLPIISTVLKTMNAKEGSLYAKGITLGTIFGAILGGTSTVVGNPANALSVSLIYRTLGYEMSFLVWMEYAVPITLVILLIIDSILLKVFPFKKDVTSGYIVFSDMVPMLFGAHLMGMGPMTRNEKVTLVLFLGAMFGWVSASIFAMLGFVHYMYMASISLLVALLLLVFGAINKEEIKNIRWDILLTLGASISLYVLLLETGIIDVLVGDLTGINRFALFSLIFVFIVVLSLILGSLASISIGVPLILLAAPNQVLSIIFMVIAANTIITGPNGLVLEEYASERGFLKKRDFFKMGSVLALISIIVNFFLLKLYIG